MGSDRYDLIVIGAGPAGQSAAELAAWTGRRAVIVERAHPGGVVATTGGAPTKTLRETALALKRGPEGPHYLELTRRPIAMPRSTSCASCLRSPVVGRPPH